MDKNSKILEAHQIVSIEVDELKELLPEWEEQLEAISSIFFCLVQMMYQIEIERDRLRSTIDVHREEI